jgi:hypothetical protein
MSELFPKPPIPAAGANPGRKAAGSPLTTRRFPADGGARRGHEGDCAEREMRVRR